MQSFLTLIQLLQQEQRIKEAEALLGELARIIADRSLVERLVNNWPAVRPLTGVFLLRGPLAPLFCRGQKFTPA